MTSILADRYMLVLKMFEKILLGNKIIKLFFEILQSIQKSHDIYGINKINYCNR